MDLSSIKCRSRKLDETSRRNKTKMLHKVTRRQGAKKLDLKVVLSNETLIIYTLSALTLALAAKLANATAAPNQHHQLSPGPEPISVTRLLASQPSQLFLSGGSGAVSLVNGFIPRRAQEEEEADGFVMQAQNGTSTTIAPTTTSSRAKGNSGDESAGATMAEDSTTIAPTHQAELGDGDTNSRARSLAGGNGADGSGSVGELTNDGSIPIDADRRQYLTHDQLSLLNASTKDENISLPSQTEQQSNQQQQPPTQSSRAGMSKVSHVSSFLSDLFAYATRATRPLEDHIAAASIAGHSNTNTNQRSKQTTSSTTTSRPNSSHQHSQHSSHQQQQQHSSSACPGVCRSILTAPILCRNEISAPCPSFLQKCCDKDDVSFDGTPVETSAPILPPDADNNPPPALADVAHTQEPSKANAQVSTATSPAPPTTTTHSAPSPGDAANGSSSSSKISATQLAAHTGPLGPTDSSAGSSAPLLGDDPLLAAGSGPVYFLSSRSSPSGATEASGNEQKVGGAGQLAQSSNSVDAHTKRTGANAGQLLATGPGSSGSKPSASQSFDSPLSADSTATDSQLVASATTTLRPATSTSRVVVLQTANGTILHQPTERPPLRRPTYANWTDYQLLMLAQGQQRPANAASSATANSVVYHSNLDQVRRVTSAGDNSGAGATTSARNELVGLAECPNVCLPKLHGQLCQQAHEVANQFNCSDESKFCCLRLKKPTEPKQQQLDSLHHNQPQLTVINDQHSANKRPNNAHPVAASDASSTTPTTTSTTSTSTVPPPPPPTTTMAQPVDTTTNQANEPSDQVGSVGNVLVQLLDSWMGNNQLSSSSSSGLSGQGDPMGEQKSNGNALSNGIGSVVIDPSEDSRLPEDANAPQATDQVSSFADMGQQNDRRLGLDLSFRQQQQQPPAPQDNFNANTSTSGFNDHSTSADLEGLMTSDGSSEQDVSTTTAGSKCEGYCTLPMFTMLCDSSYDTAACPANKKCCVTGKPTVDQLSSSNSMPSSVAASDPSTSHSSSVCRGACLPVYHSSLCTKPNELQMDSPGCISNFVCCAQPLDQQATSQFDEQNDQAAGHNGLGSDSALALAPASQPEAPIKTDSSFLAALLPPPPPPLQHQQSALVIEPSQGLAQEKSNRNDPMMSLSKTSGQRLAPAPMLVSGKVAGGSQSQASGAGGLGAGIISQIYQMFKTNGIVGGGSKRQKPAPSVQIPSHPIGQPSPMQTIMAQMYPDQGYQLSAQASGQRPIIMQSQPALTSSGPMILAPQVQTSPMHLMQAAQGAYPFTGPHQQQFIDQSQYLQATNPMAFSQLMQQQQQQQAKASYSPATKAQTYFAASADQQLASTLMAAPSYNVAGQHQQQQQQPPPQIVAQATSQIRPTNNNSNNNGNGRTQQQYVTFAGSATAAATPLSGQQQAYANDLWQRPQPNIPTQYAANYPPPIATTQYVGGHPNQLLFGASDATTPTKLGGHTSRPELQQVVGLASTAINQAPQPVWQASTSQQQQQQQLVLTGSADQQQATVLDQLRPLAAGSGNIQVRGQQSVARQKVAVVATQPSAETYQSLQSSGRRRQQQQQQQQHQQQSNQQQQSVTQSAQPQIVANNRVSAPSGGASQQSAAAQRQPSPPPTPLNPNLASSSSNLNIMFSNGPFVDLQRVAAGDAGSQADKATGGRRKQPASGGSPTSAPLKPFEFGPDSSSQATFSSGDQSTTSVAAAGASHSPAPIGHELAPLCPSTCLDPAAALTCVRPSRIDHSFACPSAGALCCVHAQDNQIQLQSAASGYQTAGVTPKGEPLVSSQAPSAHTPAIVAASASGGDHSNPVALASDQEQAQESNSDGGASKVQPPADQLDSTSPTDNSIEEQLASVAPPVAAANDKVQSVACGLPGPRRKVGASSRTGRVMGGTDAQPGYWCWQAALMNNKNEYLCGGALIGTKWVLTAAHCVTQHLRSESPLFVRLGQSNLNNSSLATDRAAKTIQVKTSYVHHNHNGITLDNDIALLRLEAAADLSEPSICSVCLPERSAATRPAALEPGRRCVVTGYGFEDESGPAALRVRQTELPMVGDLECQNKTSQALGKTFSLPANSFCAGGELGRDACHGDGGSPLSCLVDGYYELTGIVSWGYKCGSKDLPGLYSKVSAFVGWINQIVSVNN